MTNQISKLIAHIVASFEGAPEDDSQNITNQTSDYYSGEMNDQDNSMYQVNRKNSLMKSSLQAIGEEAEESYLEEQDRGYDEEEEVQVINLSENTHNHGNRHSQNHDLQEDENDDYDNYFNDFKVQLDSEEFDPSEEDLINMKIDGL